MTQAVWDRFPVTSGHALILPKRHIADWFSASQDEQWEMMQGVARVRQKLLHAQTEIAGFNVGFNVGEAAGQTIPHFHLHVIPRRIGDTPDPRGGVRNVIPSRGNYLAERHLIRGETDPLLGYLQPLVEQAMQVDIAVAFVMPTGMDLLQSLFDIMLKAGGRLRVICGDYLGVSDPDALIRLCDLQRSYPTQVILRVFTDQGAVFHPKAYRIQRRDGTWVGFVGSSNLSKSALLTGLEWNYRLIPAEDQRGLDELGTAFTQLLEDKRTVPLTEQWIQWYRDRRVPLKIADGVVSEVAPFENLPEPRPTAIQSEALHALNATRQDGNQAGLVVLATGLGKTFLAAFDSRDAKRVLFVAHREEILNQARDSFRRVRPHSRLGLFNGHEKSPDAEVLFASIQTLSQPSHLNKFRRDEFDYIIIDEFHHASSPTYRAVIEHFQPKFLLGLTATPERTDGGDLLALCMENLAYECGLVQGVTRGELCPFHYFGVPDTVNYANIPWRNGQFIPTALESALAVEARMENAYEHYQRLAGTRTLVFCCSQRHAKVAHDFFSARGVRSAVVHSGPDSHPRSTSLNKLQAGELDMICCVDIFNEGTDLPAVDTVLMLRPTESKVLWLQQIGRGLRRYPGKTVLRIIDYIGNHKLFLQRPRLLLGQTVGLEKLLETLRAGMRPDGLPPGCEMTYQLEAVELLESIREQAPPDALLAFYQLFRELRSVRPRAAEMFHEGFNPRAVRSKHGSWLGFVVSQGDLDAELFERYAPFLADLETTPMTRSYKMLLLRAMLGSSNLPGAVPLDQLTREFAAVAARSEHFRRDVSVPLEDHVQLRNLLLKNPVDAWSKNRLNVFTVKDGKFLCELQVDDQERAAFCGLVDEIIEWRLAEYLLAKSARGDFVLKVKQAKGQPMCFLDREPGMPEGWTAVKVGSRELHGNFVKIALNVVREKEDGENVLPRILRGWFGQDAGAPGTTHKVRLYHTEGFWHLEPLGKGPATPVVGFSYAREQIPGLFGLEFNPAVWNQGFVKGGNHVFLLVTMSKDGMAKGQEYDDRWVSDDIFEWHSQNRTTQQSADGQLIRNHEQLGIQVHLFIREENRKPFRYHGQVRFVEWTGERPITVRWGLSGMAS